MEVRKSHLYDNCKIIGPPRTAAGEDGYCDSTGIDGCSSLTAAAEVLSTCSLKKLQWYVDKGLGKIVSEPDPSSGEELGSSRTIINTYYSRAARNG